MLFFLTYGRYNTVWCKTSTVVYLPILYMVFSIRYLLELPYITGTR
jgi:hypothetical protein